MNTTVINPDTIFFLHLTLVGLLMRMKQH